MPGQMSPRVDYLLKGTDARDDGLESFQLIEFDFQAVRREVGSGLTAHAQQLEHKLMPWTPQLEAPDRHQSMATNAAAIGLNRIWEPRR